MRRRVVYTDRVRYAYVDPTNTAEALIWKWRAKVHGDPKRDETFWYEMAKPGVPNLLRTPSRATATGALAPPVGALARPTGLTWTPV